ncbi:unnamed protein product [Linum trigynum]|uniref:Retroviral polymerase SH3-like domain-containing protein n=1 Tax=Linum trigynum TaxID=586398 RepID=A0AAV2DSE5_9ROSI
MPLTSIQNRTPYEVLLGSRPQYSHLRTFGCLVYAKDTHSGLSKFAARGKPGVFVGYPAHQRGYRVFDVERRVIYTSRDVFFLEEVFPFQQLGSSATIPMHLSPSCQRTDDDEPADMGVFDMVQGVAASLDEDDMVPSSSPCQSASPSSPATFAGSSPPPKSHTYSSSSPSSSYLPQSKSSPESSDKTTSPTSSTDSASPASVPVEPVPRHSTRAVQLPIRLQDYEVELPGSRPQANHVVLYPISNYVNYERLSPDHHAFVAQVSATFEPTYFWQVVRYEHWQKAMQEEIKALEAKGM